jgi:hypothetical protein
MRIIYELEAKLSESETLLMKMREDEISMKKDLSNDKNEILSLKMENEQLSQLKPLLLNRKSLISKKPLLDVNLACSDKIQELQYELEKRDKMIMQIKESYLEIVLEKEKTIFELQTKLQDSDREELQKIIENLEKKTILIEEELEKSQKTVVLERERNDREISMKLNKNFQIIIDGKAKETETLLEKIREQDEKELELNKRLMESEALSKKCQNELKSLTSKNEILKNEKNAFLKRLCDLEAGVLLKEKEIASLNATLTVQMTNFEKEKLDLRNEQIKLNENISHLKNENKKQNQQINELKNQNTILKEKNSEISDLLEENQWKHDQEIKKLREKCDVKMQSFQSAKPSLKFPSALSHIKGLYLKNYVP